MSVRVLENHESDMACLYDSVTDTAFGPLFWAGDEAERFLEWLGKRDPRQLSCETREVAGFEVNALQGAVNEFRAKEVSQEEP